MKPNRSLAAALVCVGLLAAACGAKAQGPDVPTAPLAGTPFCRAEAQFRTDTQALNGVTLTSNPDEARQLLDKARDDLTALAGVAPNPVLATDIRTVASGFDQESKELANIKTTDPQAIITAVGQFVQNKQVTTAAASLDSFVHTQCGLNTEGVHTTTTAPAQTSTTVGVVGPAVPTTSASGGSTSAPGGSTSSAPPTT